MITLTKDSQHIFRIYGLCGMQAGIIGKQANSVDYSALTDTIRFKEKMLIYKATGIMPEHIVMLDQVHGNTIVNVTQRPTKNEPFIAQADGLCTVVHGVCLVIRTADCVPVILYDSRNGILTALHSGWRGCAQNITAEGIKHMRDMSANPENIYTLILPSIGPDAYQVGNDVAAQFDGYIIKKGDSLYLNMWRHIHDTALQYGIPQGNIFIANICTYYNNKEFFSHRRGDAGRNLNFVYLS